MDESYINELVQRKNMLETAVEHAKMFLDNAPEGSIRTSSSNGMHQFYHVTEQTGARGKYINKKNYNIAKALAQKEYSKIFIREATNEIKLLETLIAKRSFITAENVVGLMHENKRTLIEPYLMNKEMLLDRWVKQAYTISDYKVEEKIYPTKGGEMVRSKSEVLIADMYYELGIPYRYECELVLKNRKKKYPDFTILDVKHRRIMYHEHLGLLDNEEYRNANLEKINEYRKNGVFEGKNLIITFETKKCPININDIRASIKEMLL